MSHTPGPWKMLQEEKGQNDLSRRVHGKAPVYRVESANGGHWFIGYFRRKKDARLAAAAPELLEELREMLYYARCVYEQNGGDDEQRGLAPKIKMDIDRVEALLRRVDPEEDEHHDHP